MTAEEYIVNRVYELEVENKQLKDKLSFYDKNAMVYFHGNDIIVDIGRIEYRLHGACVGELIELIESKTKELAEKQHDETSK